MHTDHSAIIFLMNKPITNGRVTRWILLLLEFNITIIDQPGKEFVVSIQTPWFTDIANYLATRKIPSHLSPH